MTQSLDGGSSKRFVVDAVDCDELALSSEPFSCVGVSSIAGFAFFLSSSRRSSFEYFLRLVSTAMKTWMKRMTMKTSSTMIWKKKKFALPENRCNQVISNSHVLIMPYSIPQLMKTKASTLLSTRVKFIRTKKDRIDKSCNVGYGFMINLTNERSRKPTI